MSAIVNAGLAAGLAHGFLLGDARKIPVWQHHPRGADGEMT